jgi:hypothetical protein
VELDSQAFLFSFLAYGDVGFSLFFPLLFSLISFSQLLAFLSYVVL